MKPTAAQQEIARIINAEHYDPFSVLGIHETADGSVIRVFAPEAKEVSAINVHNRVLVFPLKKIHDDGFFEATIKGAKLFAYELDIFGHDGRHRVGRDPYSFLPLLGDMDLHLFKEGNHYELHKKLGATIMEVDGVSGVRFAVWAPNARRVSVVGDFCNWDGRRYQMRVMGGSGVWEIFIPGIGKSAIYKFELMSKDNQVFTKADPYAFASELRPKTASVVWDVNAYRWEDAEYMAARRTKDLLNRPMNIYEVHLASWAHRPEDDGWLSYRELAPMLVDYCKQQNFTDVELMPITEFPYDPSWGYQVIGYFSPTSRFGSPDDFKFFVDYFHKHGIGVTIDWVPAHFPKDDFGLRRFDGTALYEHEDPRLGEHKDWGTLIFNYGRHEVANFLLSSVLFLLENYHLDGIRVDAVASMLYLDYSKEPGEWLPNQFGGNENLEAIKFLQHMNTVVHDKFPGVTTFAEESTSWSGVSRPTYLGGLGFTMKWNMGWMHDTLDYFEKDPVFRKFHHGSLTFSMLYAFHENFVLPLSHDEVVHGKGALLSKMPGDYWQKFANLRLLFGYMFAHPGKKLIFQGADIGQWNEWNHEKGMDWMLLFHDAHKSLQKYLSDLGGLYLNNKCMWEIDFSHEGFEWVDFNDSENSVISFKRKAKNPKDYIIFVFNFTPVPRHGYRLGTTEPVFHDEVLNSDSALYHGSNTGNAGGVWAENIPCNQWPCSLTITLPPLGMLAFKPRRD
ncbi:MAG: 1,4-alpha-glucan branching protein GlgB [Nitrospinae bacterium]|nr:1,4-alpha-glucan branching protein GlgB [Nitrospinota bacterium]